MDAREPEARNGPLPQASPPIVSTQTEAGDPKDLGKIYQRILLAKQPTYVRDGLPTDIALMRIELLEKCQFRLQPIGTSLKNPDNPTERFKKYDYQNQLVHVTYPDGRSSSIIHIPDVALEPEDDFVFGTQGILMGISVTDFVKPLHSRLSVGCIKADRLVFEDMWYPRNTDDRWWCRHTKAHAQQFELIGAKAVGVRNGRQFYETREGNRVKGTVVCRMILKAVVLTGQEPDDNTLWRPELEVQWIEAKGLRDQCIMPARKGPRLAESQEKYEKELDRRRS